MAVYPVIMCGGSGTRLWPASRPAWPKQFIPLVGERSSFQETVLRVAGMADTHAPIIVAGVRHRAAIEAQLAELGVEAVLLLEPEARDSAPAMAAAAAWIFARDPDGVAVVVSADHHVPDAQAFRDAVAIAVGGAKEGSIVTLGMKPVTPSTAFGYIKPDASAPGPVRPVAAFVEKPAADVAQAHVAAGYLWNTGYFVTLASTLLAELDEHEPGISAAARTAVQQGASAGTALRLGESFRSAPKISIDYAVMEKTARAAVLGVDFAWSDLGAWDAVWEASAKDGEGNAADGAAIFIDSAGSFARAPAGTQVAVVGLSNVGVVVDGPTVLVLDLGKSQAVKQTVEAAKSAGWDERPGGFADLAAANDYYDGWLRTAALPLWWSLGADHENGGFHESLTPHGAPNRVARRSRVQTRQTYVYATAGAMGWDGPWRQAARHGIDFFLAHYRRPDGLFRALVGPDGAPLDETVALYDQAFAMMAMASLHAVDPGRIDLLAEADRVRVALDALRHTAGGFRESGAHPFQSNAHMHTLEAALAWSEAGGGAEWERLADEIVVLCLSRFIDSEGGFLREFFSADWTPAEGDDGRLVEPGHQFEWAWLLARWSKLRGRDDAWNAALRLFENGVAGFDPGRGVAINAMWEDLSPRDAEARLWPQTEYMKAALILGQTGHGLAATDGLAKYLNTPARGAWRDLMKVDGSFVEGPAPASSFYHIMAACRELARAL